MIPQARLANSLAFRGGKALHKLYLQPQPRYSENIDLVQVRAEPIKETVQRLKVEANTREHFTVYGLQQFPFEVKSSWFDGGCNLTTYRLEELLGTKLRALKATYPAGTHLKYGSQNAGQRIFGRYHCFTATGCSLQPADRLRISKNNID